MTHQVPKSAEAPVAGQLLTVGACERLTRGMITASAPLLFLHYADNDALVGLGNAMQYSVWVVFGLVAGAVSDVYDRAVVIRLSTWLRLVFACLGAALAAMGRLDIVSAIGFVTALAVSLVFTDTALNSSLPALYERDELIIVNSRLSVVQSTMGVVAPLIATGAFAMGDEWLFLGLAAPALVAIGTLTRAGGGALGRSGSRRLRDVNLTSGVRALFASGQLRTLLVGVTFLNLLSGMFLTVLPVLVVGERGLSASAFGVALAVRAAAVIGGNVAIARSAKRGLTNFGPLLVLSFVCRFASLVLVGFFPGAAVLMLAMAVSGIGISTWNVPASSIALEASRGDAASARIAAFKTAAMLSAPLGAGLGGLTVALWSGSGVCVGMAVASAVGGLVFYRALVRVTPSEARL